MIRRLGTRYGRFDVIRTSHTYVYRPAAVLYELHTPIGKTSAARKCLYEKNCCHARPQQLRSNPITLSRSQIWSQTWFPTCRRTYSITLSCSLAGLRPARELVADLLASWSHAGQRNGIWPATRTRHAHAGLRPAG